LKLSLSPVYEVITKAKVMNVSTYGCFPVETAKRSVYSMVGTQDGSQQDFLEGCPLIVAVNAFILIRGM
jgi:hypothetical protein